MKAKQRTTRIPVAVPDGTVWETVDEDGIRKYWCAEPEAARESYPWGFGVGRWRSSGGPLVSYPTGIACREWRKTKRKIAEETV